MSPTEKAAIIRGLYNAFGTFGITVLTAYLTTGIWEQSFIIAGVGAFTILGFRAGAEGLYDSARQKAGSVTPADVSANAPVHPKEWGVNQRDDTPTHTV